MNKPGPGIEFNRWASFDEHTWPYRLLMKYDLELMLMWGTHISSAGFTFNCLKKNGANANDSPGQHFKAGVNHDSFIPTLKDWSDAFNEFDNWVRLTVLLTLASNLETYIAAVVKLAITSDPAVLIGASRAVDGAYVLKHGKPETILHDDVVIACTKGDWSSRISSIKRTFGECPTGLSDLHGDLEVLRKIRNRFGHAFGRDIDAARKTGALKILPIEKVSRKTTERLRFVTINAAKALDVFLLSKHIGDFEALNFYHELYPSLHKHVNQGQRAQDFKIFIGRFGASPRGKIYCKGLVKYWEEL